MNKRLLTVAAFALAGCVTIVAQDKKKEFKMPTGYAGITHEMSEFYKVEVSRLLPTLSFCLTARIFPLGRA